LSIDFQAQRHSRPHSNHLTEMLNFVICHHNYCGAKAQKAGCTLAGA